MERATHDVKGRQLGTKGKLKMKRAKSTFNQAHKAVGNGEVLTTLPILRQEGLLSEANAYWSLSNGDYGWTMILTFLAFLSLAKVGIQKLSATKPRANGGFS